MILFFAILAVFTLGLAAGLGLPRRKHTQASVFASMLNDLKLDAEWYHAGISSVRFYSEDNCHQIYVLFDASGRVKNFGIDSILENSNQYSKCDVQGMPIERED